jgi:magnesium chelatase subunit H
MKQKPTTADKLGSSTPVRVVLITLDNHVSAALESAQKSVRKLVPGLRLSVHAAADWEARPDKLAACKEAIAEADIIIATMLFMEPHIVAVLEELESRRTDCDALICCMCAAEVMKLTRMGKFRMDGEQSGAVALLKRLRGKSSKPQSAGAQQLSILRRLPRILRFIPGTAQDLRVYFLTLQYWLAGSEKNLASMIQLLIQRYAGGPRAALRRLPEPPLPVEYPEVGIYHPGLKTGISEDRRALDKLASGAKQFGTVGVLLMRSYALAGNSRHYDGVIRALESRGLSVIPAFASGLDARPAVHRFFMDGDKPTVDAVVSLTGFSLVGGPAYNDTDAAQELLKELDVPYLAVQALEFQSLETWTESALGLMPIEATMMVSIPELDGATGPMVFGGRQEGSADKASAMVPHEERIEMLAERVSQLVALRHTPKEARKVAVVLFNFPPNAGSTGTAAHLAVFDSLFNTLKALSAEGYAVDLPASVEDLRERLLQGNASRYGTDANVCATVNVNDHVTAEPWLSEIEAQWGPAPGKQLTDGRSIFILGLELGNVMITVQPPMGYEGDPMRLLFEGGHAPTHAFSAFYRYLREDWKAGAVLHFGTHGALEFMPGKQVGLSAACWPDRLIGACPNFYLYAANNPSEGLIAKRRSAATLISYLTPSVAQADLYKEYRSLGESIDQWRKRDISMDPEAVASLMALIAEQAEQCELSLAGNWSSSPETAIEDLRCQLQEIEESLIPYGLHVVGELLAQEDQIDLLNSIARAHGDVTVSVELLQDLLIAVQTGEQSDDLVAAGKMNPDLMGRLSSAAQALSIDNEIPSLLRALDGRFIPPVSGGDLLTNPEVLPTGRNLHGFDPFRVPSDFALHEGARQAEQLLDRHAKDGSGLPQSVALVLWGTDNLKSGGVAIAQALHLIGAKPRIDGYGRICGANLIPLEDLGRPRIDVVMTLSGIFRDLLPLQTRLLAEAAYLAVMADEPAHLNPIRAHALDYQAKYDCDLEDAALRVFSNAEGTYGSNVNMLIDSGAWDSEDELADTFTIRKGHAYGRNGAVEAKPDLLTTMLADVDLAYQNLDSVELGVTTVDHYFDSLGGISRAISKTGGADVPVYIADHTTGREKIRTLAEQVALETRTRVLNPKWYESMLDHGYEGVRAIETHVTNTMGWSATTGQVAPWVYQQLSETFILDEAMRKRLASLNPKAAARVANRLLEAQERNYWDPDEASLNALREAGEDLDDWIEGISPEAVA